MTPGPEEKKDTGKKPIYDSSIKFYISNFLINYLKEISVFFALITIIIFFSIIKIKYISGKNILNILETSNLTGIVAIGQLIVLLVGGIDLSVGSVIGLSGVTAAFLMNAGFGTGTAILAGLSVGVFFGLLNGLIITKIKVIDFIGTLGTMFIAHGFIMAITRGKSIYKGLQSSFLIIGSGKIAGISFSLIGFIVLSIIVHFILSKTVFGRQIYASGGNQKAARLMGVQVDMIKIIAYIISGFLSSIVGIIIVGRLKSGQPSAGDSFLFETILAVILGGASLSGGVGTVAGTFIGAVFLGALFNGLNISGFPFFYQEVLKGGIFIIAVAFGSFVGLRNRKFRN